MFQCFNVFNVSLKHVGEKTWLVKITAIMIHNEKLNELYHAFNCDVGVDNDAEDYDNDDDDFIIM